MLIADPEFDPEQERQKFIKYCSNLMAHNTCIGLSSGTFVTEYVIFTYLLSVHNFKEGPETWREATDLYNLWGL